MEGRHGQVAALAGRLLGQLSQEPREWLVEADEERVVALAREPSSLLGGEQRLAGPGRADDLHPAVALQPLQDALLVVGQLDGRPFALGDLAPEQALELDWRLEDLLEEMDADGTGRAAVRRLGRPGLESSIDRVTGGRRIVGRQGGVVEDQFGDEIRAEEAEARASAGEVDIGQGDCVAADRTEVGRPIRQLIQLVHQGMEAALRLAERVGVEAVRAGVPTTVGVAPDLARLRLDDQEAALRVGDHEIGLAVAQLTVVAGSTGPFDVGEDAVLGLGQGGADPLLNEQFGGLTGGQRWAQAGVPSPSRRPRAAAIVPTSVGRQSSAR